MATDGKQVQVPDTLPSDLAACHALIEVQRDHLDDATRKITKMEHQLDQLLRRLYGRSSEKIDPKQMALFAEMLKQLEAQNSAAVQIEPTPAVTPTTSNHKGHGRRRLAPDLPRETRLHDLPDNEKPCPCCGTMRTVIGQEVSEQLDYEPAKVKVIEHVRLKYICKECERQTAEGGPQIATAEKPLSPIEKGLAAPGLLAYVIVSKYTDHLPLHRLEKILERHNIDIARSTMCDWMRQSADALKPLHDLLIKEVLGGKVIHTDDTPVDVLDRLVKELRLAGAMNMEEGNEVLAKKFLPWFNRRCTVRPASPNDAHRPLHPSTNLSIILSIQENRRVANDYTIRLDNQAYQLLKPVLPGLRGGRVTVEKWLDGTLHIRFKNHELAYHLIGPADRLGSLPPNPRSLSHVRTPAEPAQNEDRAATTAQPSADVLPLGARVALLRSPVLPKASRSINARNRGVQRLSILGGNSASNAVTENRTL